MGAVVKSRGYVKTDDGALTAFAVSEGTHPEVVAIGQVYERVAMLCRDGRRFQLTGNRDHELIQIVSVPGGRRRTIRYVKIDPKPRGNGRADKQEHSIDRMGLVRHYSLVD